jgi:hypothetical protein
VPPKGMGSWRDIGTMVRPVRSACVRSLSCRSGSSPQQPRLQYFAVGFFTADTQPRRAQVRATVISVATYAPVPVYLSPRDSTAFSYSSVNYVETPDMHMGVSRRR